jgi:hypothetical protein
MNRIVLIGNGFDLSHGMKTSYNDFLKDFWESLVQKVFKFEGKEIYEDDFLIIRNVPSKWLSGLSYNNFKESVSAANTKIEFKNIFLDKISEKSYIQNWVDIEKEYYELLQLSYKETKEENNYSIKQLNIDFQKIKELLGDYLKKIETDFDANIDINTIRIKSTIGHKIYAPFKLKDFSEESINERAQIEYDSLKKNIEAVSANHISIEELSEYDRKIISRLGKKSHINEIRKMLISGSALNYFELVPNQTLFLNFNYTFTERLYDNPNSFENYHENKVTVPKFIHIHGTTDKSDKNPIIFGFGDELDDEYKEIEKLDDNKYLENIKSINYLETDNYKRLLEFVNSEKYQIFILGHSCGISDRTLLNTLFENDNCSSIKPFYHLRNENDDNFSDMVRNISRNFNDKAKMRDRVVNKAYCEPLR